MTLAFALISAAALTPEQFAAAAEPELPAGEVVHVDGYCLQLRDATGHELLSWWESRPIQVAASGELWADQRATEGIESVKPGTWWTEVSVPYACRLIATPVLRRLAEQTEAELKESE